MNRFYISSLFASALIVCGSDLFAQPAAPLPSKTLETVRRETEREGVEYVMAEMPIYNEVELARLIVYPADARAAKLQGTVVVSFVVDTNGTVDRFEALESPSPLLTDAAIDAIRILPFIPGRYQGRPIRIRMTLPVRFTLTD